MLLLPALIGGAMAPPYNLGLMNGLLDVPPERHRPTYIAAYTAMSSFASFVAPVLSTVVIVPLIGLRSAIFFGAGMRLLGWLAVYLLVRKPAASHPE